MTARFSARVSGDNLSSFTWLFVDDAGNLEDLAGFTATLSMHALDAARTPVFVDQACTVAGAAVEYAPAIADVSVTESAEFVLTLVIDYGGVKQKPIEHTLVITARRGG